MFVSFCVVSIVIVLFLVLLFIALCLLVFDYVVLLVLFGCFFCLASACLVSRLCLCRVIVI